MNVKYTVLAFIKDNAVSPLPEEDDTQLLACHYLDAGIIDSLGIINMVTSFEEDFSITFSAEDMQSYEFQTIGGLIALIERKLHK